MDDRPESLIKWHSQFSKSLQDCVRERAAARNVMRLLSDEAKQLLEAVLQTGEGSHLRPFNLDYDHPDFWKDIDRLATDCRNTVLHSERRRMLNKALDEYNKGRSGSRRLTLTSKEKDSE